ncbi:MAG: hypothetical protein NVSMB32_08810 [Actinomycetota bacterium]
MAFDSLHRAAASLEYPDVDEGEYVALFTLGGRIVKATTARYSVVLTVTDEHDEPALRQRLRRHWQRAGLGVAPDDLVSAANQLLRCQWEGRCPRRPTWLARRLHGDGPPTV